MHLYSRYYLCRSVQRSYSCALVKVILLTSAHLSSIQFTNERVFYNGALISKECSLKNWHLSQRNNLLFSYSFHLKTWSQIALKQNHFHIPESAALLSRARLASINTVVWNDHIIRKGGLLFTELYLVSKAYLASYSVFFLHYLTIHFLSIINLCKMRSKITLLLIRSLKHQWLTIKF